jgi:hypothetical protein
MSHRLIKRLRSVRDEYDAARAALALTQRRWPTAHAEPELDGQTLDALRTAVKNLEATYTARLFFEFEGILRTQYPNSRPGGAIPRNADGLIGGLGRRYRIPPENRERVHEVRNFRHSVVHADPGTVPVAFPDALSWLCQYLAYIPDGDVP